LYFLFPDKFNVYVVGWLENEAAFTLLEILKGEVTTFNYGLGDTKHGEVIGNIHEKTE